MSESFTPRSLLARAIQELRRTKVGEIEIAEALEYLRRVDVELERAEKEGSHHEAPKALRAEVERLNRILGRIVEGDGDSIMTIRAGTDAFAAAMEYLRSTGEGEQQ